MHAKEAKRSNTGAAVKIITKTETLCNLTVGGALEEDSLPKEVRTYVYRVTYSGDKEQYASSYADIVMEITEAVLIKLTPENNGDITLKLSKEYN